MFGLFKKNKGFEEKNLLCPRCNVIMRKIKKQDVVIDVCGKCNGIWLDDNEIEKLVAYANQKPKKTKKQRKVNKNGEE